MSSTLINNFLDPNDGEKKFARLIDNIQEENPHYDFRLYYEPEGHDIFPDFVLYSPVFGVVFFEIKDIIINEVDSFNHQSIKFNRKTGKQTLHVVHPKIVHHYIDEFKQCNASVPVSIFYVFTNISALELEQKFDFDSHNIKNPFILADDFTDYESFINKLKYHKKFLYNETERSKSIAIHRIERKKPQSVIKKNDNGTFQIALFEDLESENSLITLSNHQAKVEKDFMNLQGFRFLKGYAGSGKTLLLSTKAELIAKNFPNKNILITYYTSQLDGVFAHLMNKYPNILAERMGRFCNSKIKPKDESTPWPEYYLICSQIISKEDHPYNQYYDHIFVDEGQDFSIELGIIIEQLAKGKDYKNKNVVIAFDDLQALNIKEAVDTTETFRGKQRGRVKRLKISYRTPAEIVQRASRLINQDIDSSRTIKNAYFFKHFSAVSEIIKFIDNTINQAREKEHEKIEFRDIAIIYPHLNTLHYRIKEDMKGLKKPYQIYDRKEKKTMSMESPSIKILSSTYCKGLDFRIVFLIYFEELTEKGQQTINKKAREHLYVSMTRTKEYLFVLTLKSTPLLDIINLD